MQNTVYNGHQTSPNDNRRLKALAFIHQVIGGVEKIYLPPPGHLPGIDVKHGMDMSSSLRIGIGSQHGINIEVGDSFAVMSDQDTARGRGGVEIVYFAHIYDQLGQTAVQATAPTDRWFAADELRNDRGGNAELSDAEFTAICKGFALLWGDPLEF